MSQSNDSFSLARSDCEERSDYEQPTGDGHEDSNEPLGVTGLAAEQLARAAEALRMLTHRTASLADALQAF